jgi:hypothetical protein
VLGELVVVDEELGATGWLVQLASWQDGWLVGIAVLNFVLKHSKF